jgi:hypothetical protein
VDVGSAVQQQRSDASRATDHGPVKSGGAKPILTLDQAGIRIYEPADLTGPAAFGSRVNRMIAKPSDVTGGHSGESYRARG